MPISISGTPAAREGLGDREALFERKRDTGGLFTVAKRRVVNGDHHRAPWSCILHSAGSNERAIV